MISLDSDEYSVREDVGTFMAVVTATRAAEFPYTVSVDSVDETAIGKKMDRYSMHDCIEMYTVMHAATCTGLITYTHGITQSMYIKRNC